MGQYTLFELSASKANSIYIPKGMAHGFCVLSEQAVMVYKASTVYSSAHDAGVLWDSIGVPWPVKYPCVSDRDKTFLPLADYESPFTI